tara:strand:+ start:379 stop:624 length:246 start_codon:yes stop_codon:yes gene_type:complete
MSYCDFCHSDKKPTSYIKGYKKTVFSADYECHKTGSNFTVDDLTGMECLRCGEIHISKDMDMENSEKIKEARKEHQSTFLS